MLFFALFLEVIFFYYSINKNALKKTFLETMLFISFLVFLFVCIQQYMISPNTYQNLKRCSYILIESPSLRKRHNRVEKSQSL